jgi:hypothetical protein
MSEKNLRRLDDVLITTGYGSLVVALFVAAASHNLFVRLLVVCGPLVLLIVGYRVRAEEKKMVAIWSILEQTLEVSVPELERSTGFGRGLILQTVRDINAQGLGYFVHDLKADRIFDGRLRSQMVTVESCSSCGARVDATFEADLSTAPVCRFCGSAFSAGELNRLKLDLLSQLRTAPGPIPSGRKTFSIGVFVALMLCFWPAAIVYALSRRHA